MATEISEKKAVSPIVAIVVILVVIGLVGGIGYYVYFAPPPKSEKALLVEATLDELARKSGGDLSKLSPEEQKRANDLTAGHADLALKGVAKDKGYAK